MATKSAERQREQYARRIADGLCRGCGSRTRKPKKGARLCSVCLKRKLAYYHRNRDARDAYNRKYKKKLREEVYAAYGGAICRCCGERHVEFLTIDHENGDGADHRREIGRATQQILLWLKRNDFPPGFRILCMNCNFALGMHGYCPHQKESPMSIEKYGVDESVKNSEQLEKKAAQGCPECGSKVTVHGKVLMCPKCGTEPFETQNSG